MEIGSQFHRNRRELSSKRHRGAWLRPCWTPVAQSHPWRCSGRFQGSPRAFANPNSQRRRMLGGSLLCEIRSSLDTRISCSQRMHRRISMGAGASQQRPAASPCRKGCCRATLHLGTSTPVLAAFAPSSCGELPRQPPRGRARAARSREICAAPRARSGGWRREAQRVPQAAVASPARSAAGPEAAPTAAFLCLRW